MITRHVTVRVESHEMRTFNGYMFLHSLLANAVKPLKLISVEGSVERLPPNPSDYFCLCEKPVRRGRVYRAYP